MPLLDNFDIVYHLTSLSDISVTRVTLSPLSERMKKKNETRIFLLQECVQTIIKFTLSLFKDKTYTFQRHQQL